MIDAIRSGIFGDAGVFEPLIGTLFEGKDQCASIFFPSPPLLVIDNVDRLGLQTSLAMTSSATSRRRRWSTRRTSTRRAGLRNRVRRLLFFPPSFLFYRRADSEEPGSAVLTSARMGFFSSDRAVSQYAEGASIFFLTPFCLLLLSLVEADSSLSLPPAYAPSTEIWNVEPVVAPEPKR